VEGGDVVGGFVARLLACRARAYIDEGSDNPGDDETPLVNYQGEKVTGAASRNRPSSTPTTCPLNK